MTKPAKKIDGQVEKRERDLKARLAYNGFTQAAVAKALGAHFTTVNKTIKGHRRSPRVLRFIEALPLAERVS